MPSVVVLVLLSAQPSGELTFSARSRRREGHNGKDVRVPGGPSTQRFGTPTILVADQGANAHGAGGPLDTFRLAIRLGATGVRTTLSCDPSGEPVLAVGRSRLGRRRAGSGSGAVTLGALADAVGPEARIVLDVLETGGVQPLLVEADRGGHLARLWLVHEELHELARWRGLSEGVGLVQATRMRSVPGGVERLAAQLRDARVDALALPWSEWTAGHVTMVHRFGRLAWGTGAEHQRMAEALLRMDADAVCGPWPDRLVDAARAVVGAI